MKRFSEMFTPEFFIPSSQVKRQRKSLSSHDKKPGPDFRDGSLKKLVVSNFMVHQKLELEFGSNVNIITGVNGSGKSAVLQAIVLALGVTAKESKRGSSSLTTFIRNNSDRADIQLTIFNDGPDAYKPEVYGSEIIFERILRRTGGNSQCVRSGQNPVKYQGGEATKEREAICNHFNIEPTNSMSILQQEEAKVFFSATNGYKLYHHFLQGTLMQFSQELMTDTKKDHNRCKAALESKKAELANTEKLYNDLEEQEDRLVRVDVSQQIKDLNANIKWGMVEIEKEKVVKTTSDIEKAKKKLTELQSREQELIKSHDVLVEQNGEIEQTNADVQSDIEVEAKLRGSSNKDFETKSEEKEERIKAIESLNGEINRITKELQERRNDVRKMRMASAKGGDLSEAERKTRIQKMIDNKRKEADEIQSQISGFSGKQSKIDEESSELLSQKEEAVAKKIEILGQEKKLLAIQNGASSRFDDISRFGRKMTGLLERIEKNKSSFAKPPIGPLGRHIKLVGEAAKNEGIAKVLETELGPGLLRAFIVDSQRDYDTLKQMLILQDLARTTVYQKQFLGQRHDIGRFEAKHPEAKGVLGYLKFDNDEVFNIVVDMKKVESVLVCDRRTAEDLFSRKERVPSNATKIITPDFYEYFPPTTGNYSSYYMNPAHSGLLIGDDSNSADQLEGKKRKIATEKKENEKDLNIICEALKRLEEQKKRNKSIHDKQNADLNSIRQDISRLMIELETDTQSMEQTEEVIQNLEKEVEKKRADLRLLSQEQSRTKRELAEQIKIVDACQKRIDELRKQLITNEDLELRLKEQSLEISRLGQDQKKKELEIKSLTAKLTDLMKVYEGNKLAALTSSEHKERKVAYTPKQIEAMMAELNAIQAKNVGKDGLKLQEVSKKKHLTKMKKLTLKLEVDKFTKTIKEMEEMIEVRRQRLCFLLNAVVRCTKRAFSDYLALNNLSGTYEMNNKEKTLTLKVNPSVGSDSYDGGAISLTTLSGGERSKTVVCLIMAFWHQMSCPFRCLDEWDVYLDDKARRTTEEILVKSAKETPYQYIFISPQSSAYVNSPETNLRVIEIQPRK